MTLMSLRLMFDGLMLAFFGYAFVESMTFLPLARTLPRTAAGAGLFLTGLLVLRDTYSAVRVRRDASRVLPEEDETASLHQAAHEGSISPVMRGVALHTAWIIGFLVLAWLFSLPVGAFIYVLLFLRLESGMSTRAALTGAVATVAFMYVIQRAMNLGMPASLWNPLGTWF